MESIGKVQRFFADQVNPCSWVLFIGRKQSKVGMDRSLYLQSLQWPQVREMTVNGVLSSWVANFLSMVNKFRFTGVKSSTGLGGTAQA